MNLRVLFLIGCTVWFVAMTRGAADEPHQDLAWRGNEQARLAIGKGELVVSSGGDDPWLTTTDLPTVGGPFTFDVRFRSKTSGAAQVLWATADTPDFDPRRSATTGIEHDGQLRTYQIAVPEKQRLTSLRFDPCGGRGEVAVEWMRLRGPDGLPLKTWDFSGKLREPKLSVIGNGEIRVGINLAAGGAITYLSPVGRERNLVNNFDYGRQIQQSYYSGPTPFVVGDKRPPTFWNHIGWNPVQAGDEFGHSSRVVEHRRTDAALYVKCVPQHWPLDDVPAECDLESWVTLDGPAVLVKNRLTMRRADKTQYPARLQEMPAVYTNGPYHRLFTYSGPAPFTGGELTRVVKPRGEPGPWTHWWATERWSAHVDDSDWGLGVWQPGCTRFGGGFAGKPGQGGTFDLPTGYIAPSRPEILDHNIVYEYEYRLIVGTLKSIRSYVYERCPRPTLPAYRFAADRRGWHYANAADEGWPIADELRVRLERDDPYLLGPSDAWLAAEASTLVIDAAYQTDQTEGRVFWSTLDQPGFGGERSIPFPIVADGKFHTYRLRLGEIPTYRGLITGLRFDPVGRGRPGDWLKLKELRLER